MGTRSAVGWRLGLALAVVVGLVTSCGHSTGEPAGQARPAVLVDTDLAADDILALTYLLGDRNVDVVAITVDGNGVVRCPAGAANARAVVAATGHRSVPVGCGADRPSRGTVAFPTAWRDQADAFYGMAGTWTRPTDAAPDDAVDLMVSTARAHPGLVVVALGPLTTVAAASTNADFRAAHPRIVVSGGALDVSGNMPPQGGTLSAVEWNIGIDPAAAARVLESGLATTWVPLDASNQVPADQRLVTALEQQHRNPAGDAALAFLRANLSITRGGFYLWDPLAAVAASEPAAVRYRTIHLSVTTDGADAGRTTAGASGPAVQAAVGTDTGVFDTALLDGLSADGHMSGTYPPATPTVTVTRALRAFAFDGPATVPAGDTPFGFTASGTGFAVVVLRLAPGHTMAEVRGLVAAGATTAPSWASIEATVDVPDNSQPQWVIALPPGLHVVIGAERDGAHLTVLGQVRSR